MKHFYSSFVIAFIGLALGYFIGGFEALYLVLVLSLLEVSLSFDNAVVNAKVLETMDPVWQKRFILFGMPIAVFGMRLIFPIALVALTTTLTFIDVGKMAIYHPEQYRDALHHGFPMIAAFGGSFLLMVFMDFFFDNEREVRWIKQIENNKAILGLSKIDNIELVLAIIVGIILTSTTESYHVAIAYSCGVVLHSLLNIMDEIFSPEGDDASGLSNVARNGLIGLLYLEVLDASFSFDGVIGSFAISMNIFIIMIGLGVGAMFVRSLTIYLVEKKTLKEFVFLEHGAHYAIGFLAITIFLKIFIEIPEWLTGSVGIFFILTAFIHSQLYKSQK